MPELPEVETVRRGLSPHLEGKSIVNVDIRRPDLRFPFAKDLDKRLTGLKIRTIDRRGKYLLIRLDDDSILLNSVGMSGRWTMTGEGIAFTPGTFAHGAVIGTGDGPHDHFVLNIEGGIRATYTDARRFGYIHFIESDVNEEDDRFLSVLGPEPMSQDFDATVLAKNLKNRSGPIKNTLLDQSVVAGLGNIYVNEVLNRTGISPRRISSTLVRKNGSPTSRLELLVEQIQEVLSDAIEAGGSTLQDFRGVSGEDDLGWFPVNFRVYGREGLPCVRDDCSGIVQRIVQANRSTFFCPSCQR